jgi:hypothetical protein
MLHRNIIGCCVTGSLKLCSVFSYKSRTAGTAKFGEDAKAGNSRPFVFLGHRIARRRDGHPAPGCRRRGHFPFIAKIALSLEIDDLEQDQQVKSDPKNGRDPQRNQRFTAQHRR